MGSSVRCATMTIIDTINQSIAVVDSLKDLMIHSAALLGVVVTTLHTAASAASAIIPNGTLPDLAHKIINTAALNVGNAKNAGVDS